MPIVKTLVVGDPAVANETVVLTCTGDRAQAFNLCRKYHARWTHPHRWIVVDGPGASYDLNLYRGLMRLSPGVKRIVIMEDDDWYGADHLERSVVALEGASIHGYAPDVWYNIATQTWCHRPNRDTAALASTSFRIEALPLFLSCLDEYTGRFLDFTFWQSAALNGFKTSLSGDASVIGIKGMPGRGGLGYGHQWALAEKDPSWDWLRSQIGGDVEDYINIARLNR